MKEVKTTREKAASILYVIVRICALVGVCVLFLPFFNPAYVFSKVDAAIITNTTSVFTNAISYDSIVGNFGAAFSKGLLQEGPFALLRAACIVITIGSLVAAGAACMTAGNTAMKHTANKIMMGGAIVLGIGAALVFIFWGKVPGMVAGSEADAPKQETSSMNLTYGVQTDKTTAGEGVDMKAGNVYGLTIKNESGKDLNGWAIEIAVGEGFDTASIKKLNKWFRVGQKESTYSFHTEMIGDKLIITPDNYRLKDEDGVLVLTQDGEANEKNAAITTVAAGSTLKITLVCDGLSGEEEAVITEGGVQKPLKYAFPSIVYFYVVLAALMFVLSLAIDIVLPKAPADMSMEMDSKYQLFLMFLPFLLLIAAFSYLPLWGWRYAFFEDANKALNAENWVGFKWFKLLFSAPAYRTRFLNVMKNTLAMSGLGLLTSWLPMAFAIFLNEVKSTKFKRFVQTFATIPNFISWVLVYAIAFSIFSTDGLINNMLGSQTDFLASGSHLWLKMLAWGVWKGVGWSAIIYISGIAGIDQQLYEAATVDGADRFQRMRHITLPGLLPTYIVMLVMSIAGILSNGMDQYLVFSNAATATDLEVLDLYVYNMGIGSNLIPMSTVISMGKSIISVILFFIANSAAKAIRGNGIA